MKGKQLTMGSLFSGSGGFELASLLSGIRPVWASEVEPYPVRVTTRRMPWLRHLGDIHDIHGGEIEPVDIITGGSPCQDVSIAGKRTGLEGARSGLFFEMIRVIREMREKTDGRYPRYIIWENVPGAFSSSGGEDFRTVIEEFCRIRYPDVSVPKAEKWHGAGLILEDGFSLAWRVLDAQYWGVPQRRRRIYLVVDLDGGCAGKILLESESLPGNPEAGIGEREEAPGTPGDGAHGTGQICLNDQGGERMTILEEMASTLRAKANHPPIVLDTHPADSRIELSEKDTIQTLTSRMGTGGGNTPLLLTPKTMRIRCGKPGGGKGALIQDDTSGTLGTSNDQTLFVPTAYRISAKESWAMKSPNPEAGIGEAEVSRTIDTKGTDPTCNQGGIAVIDRKTPMFSMNKGSHFTEAETETAGTLVATDHKDPPVTAYGDMKGHYAVRRLTPTECARLQGFPDWWTEGLGTENPTDDEIAFWRAVFITWQKAQGKEAKPKADTAIRKWLKDPSSDSAAYKLWGNGIALPCALYVLRGLAFWDGYKEQQ